MDDAPDVWSDEATEEPLEEAHEEDVVVELVVEAGADHGADAAGEGDEVEDGAEERVFVLKRNDRVLAAGGAAFASFQIFSHNLNY